MSDNVMPFPNKQASEQTTHSSSDEARLASILHGLKAWLKVNHPAALSRVRPPADPATLETLRSACPEVPHSLIQLLKLQDGEFDSQLKGMMFDHYRLLGADEILSFRKLLTEEGSGQESSLDTLVPFAARQGTPSGLLCVTPNERPEAIIEVTHEEVIEFDASLVTFLEQYSQGLRSGAFKVVKTPEGTLIQRNLQDKPDLDTPELEVPPHENESPSVEAQAPNPTESKTNTSVEEAARAVLPEMLLIKAPESTTFDAQDWGEPHLVKDMHKRLIKAGFECYGFAQLEGQVHGTFIKHLSYFRDKDRVLATLLELSHIASSKSVGVALEVSHIFEGIQKNLVTWNSTGRYVSQSPPGVEVQVAQSPNVDDMAQQLSNMRKDRLPLRVSREQCLATLQQSIQHSFEWLINQALDLDALVERTTLFQQVNLSLTPENRKAFKAAYVELKERFQHLHNAQLSTPLPDLTILQQMD